jgi:hypothetical protein
MQKMILAFLKQEYRTLVIDKPTLMRRYSDIANLCEQHAYELPRKELDEMAAELVNKHNASLR